MHNGRMKKTTDMIPPPDGINLLKPYDSRRKTKKPDRTLVFFQVEAHSKALTTKSRYLRSPHLIKEIMISCKPAQLLARFLNQPLQTCIHASMLPFRAGSITC